MHINYLIKLSDKHSKVNNSIYHNCDGCGYFKFPKFTPDLANLLFKFRTRTYMVKNNFRQNYRNTDTLCPLCGMNNDTQEHILKCFKIIKSYQRKIQCSYEDIYSPDIDTLFRVASTLKELTQIRQKQLDMNLT